MTIEEQLEEIDKLTEQDCTEEFEEIFGIKGIINPLTGEIINIFDTGIPVEEKADAVRWKDAQISDEIALCTETIDSLKLRVERLKKVKDSLRSTFLHQMVEEGYKNIKSLLATIYITKRDLIKYNYTLIQKDNVQVTLREKITFEEASKRGYTLDSDAIESMKVIDAKCVPEIAKTTESKSYLNIRKK